MGVSRAGLLGWWPAQGLRQPHMWVSVPLLLSERGTLHFCPVPSPAWGEGRGLCGWPSTDLVFSSAEPSWYPLHSPAPKPASFGFLAGRFPLPPQLPACYLASWPRLQPTHIHFVGQKLFRPSLKFVEISSCLPLIFLVISVVLVCPLLSPCCHF